MRAWGQDSERIPWRHRHRMRGGALRRSADCGFCECSAQTCRATRGSVAYPPAQCSRRWRVGPGADAGQKAVERAATVPRYPARGQGCE